MTESPRGYRCSMTNPDRELSMADVAREDPEESVQHEQEVLGDQPDTGDLVTPDHSQSAPVPDGQ